jgi:transposase
VTGQGLALTNCEAYDRPYDQQTSDRIEIITSVQRRRRWTAAEKMRLVEETFAPGMTVSLVARQNGGNPNQLFTWRRLAA